MHALFHSRDSAPEPAVEPVPTVFPKIEGVDIAAVFVGNRVAGDFYDSIRVSPERILFGLLDVAGRRDENRGILTAAQQIFRTAGPELFSRPDINESEAMTELAHRLNRGLIEIAHEVRSSPAFIGCYHEKFGTLCYTNAGHIPGLLRDHGQISELGSTGLPLGLFSHATSDAPIIGLEKGSALLLISRGVLECEGHHKRGHNSNGEDFGLENAKQAFLAAPLGTAHDLCSSILAAAGESPSCDDRTALAVIRGL